MFDAILEFFERVTGQDDPILREISVATGAPLSALRGLNSQDLLDVIVRAGIPMADIPPHIIEALGLIPLRQRR